MVATAVAGDSRHMTITAEQLAWPAPRSLRAPRLRAPRLRRGWLELAAVVGIYAVYSAARTLVPGDAAVARVHAADIMQVERWLHLDIEAAANGWLSAHAGLALVASYWYAALHYTVTPVLLIVLRSRAPRAAYRALRNGLMAATLLAVIGYAAFPAMPPRMLGGFTDTLAATSGSGWWGAEASAPRGMGGMTNQFAAMPSMHVGWAVWCALAGSVLLAGSRWRRLVWLYPLGTLVVVVATANHYLVDGIVGAALVVAVCARMRR
jgi:hypothetical protein